MMEVTPHLKSVLKNYQHSAIKSLQGPGLGLSTLTTHPKDEPSSPDLKEEEEFVATPFPVQQLPILTTPDTSCSERTETCLEGETISCFVVGGEKRLCLPQVLNSVLRDFSLPQINLECDQLQIYCSRCTPEQLNVLKNGGVLPSGAASSGLITKTDAERLCSALLHGQGVTAIRPRKGALSFAVYHKCFGKCRGMCYPELFTAKSARCIECVECRGGFSPQQFVCHVHKHFSENRTVHWGFDSSNWRMYLRVAKEQGEQQEQFSKCLDDMREQFEGKMPFPLPQNIFAGIKRKQVLASEVINEHELPLKKQKILGEFLNPTMSYHLYNTLDAMYLNQYIHQELNATRHLSAFKPVNHHHKESKIYNHLMGMGINRYTDPPVLQNPERVVLMSESERFERTYQPNVALAPPTPKKHRYGKGNHIANNFIKEEVQIKKEQEPIITNNNNDIVIKQELDVEVEVDDEKPAEKSPVNHKNVSVLQSTQNNLPRYNSEIELSTDTEDSASETSEKPTHLGRVEELLKSVDNEAVREKILAAFRALLSENEKKDERIKDLEGKLGNGLQNVVAEEEPSEAAAVMAAEEKTAEEACPQVVCNGDVKKIENNCSSITKTTENCEHEGQKTSVIASLETESKAIINTAPE